MMPDALSMHVAEFLDRVYAEAANGRERAALDLVIEFFDDHMGAGEFLICDNALTAVDVSRLSSSVMYGFLVASRLHRRDAGRLPSRAGLYDRVRAAMIPMKGQAATDNLLEKQREGVHV